MIDIPETPLSRVENYLGKMIGQDTAKVPDGIYSRVEAYLYALLATANTRYSMPKRIGDSRLYYIEYEALDYDYGLSYMLNKTNPGFGACSSVINGTVAGRNYDWYYDHKVPYVVGRKATQGKHGSIGMAGLIIDDTLAEELCTSALYSVLPFTMLDGINDAGVYCNVNIVPELDKQGDVTGTNPGKPNVPMVSLIRMILDNCESAEDAVTKIENDWNIIGPSNGFIGNEDGHIMIADSEKTYIVEFVNNASVVINTFVDDKPIMTNFYLSDYDGTEDSLKPYSQGIERYAILSEGFNSADSVEDMKTLMESVHFTKAYTITDPENVWYSEFNGKYSGGLNLKVGSPKADYEPVLEVAREDFENRSRDTGKTWETVHTSVYDISNMVLSVAVEENDDYESFYIPQD